MLLVGGCSGSLTVDSYYAGVADLVVRARACAGIATSLGEQQYSCRDQRFAADAEKLVAGSRTRFDPVAARKCLSELEVLIEPKTCWGPDVSTGRGEALPNPSDLLEGFIPIVDRLPAECGRIFTGLVPVGQVCIDWRDCAPGPCINEGAGGACHAARGPGEPCDHDFCAPGLRCSPAGACVPIVGRGNACGADAICARGLVCDSGACAERRAAGQPCSAVDDCQNGLLCAADGTCEPERQDGACIGWNDCPGNQVCALPGDANPYSGSAGTCLTPQDIGGPCIAGLQGYNAHCYQHLVCDPQSSKCAAPPQPAHPCIEGICDPFSAWCDNGACKPLPVLGQSCSTRCAQGFLCVQGFCKEDAEASCP